MGLWSKLFGLDTIEVPRQDKPLDIDALKARQLQIRILKKEKKDYSHIQDLLDKNL